MPNKKPTLEAQIDENLRRVFEEDAQAELPQTLLDLLSQLDDVDVPVSSRRAAPKGGASGAQGGNGS